MGKVTSAPTARRQTANGRAGTPIEKLLAEARLKLIETGTRNRLIHAPRGAKRSRALPITGNASDDVFASLVRENKPLRVLAAEESADIERDAATPETPRLVTPQAGDRNGLRTSLPASFCISGCMPCSATRRPPRRSAASTSSSSPLVFCAGTRTKNPTRRAPRR
jgi:hypothetical protein